jgi:hypothetical protein
VLIWSRPQPRQVLRYRSIGRRRRHRRLSAWPRIASSSGSCPISRTSCAHRQATAILAAHSSASSHEGTSTSVNPPMASGYGASVTVPSVVYQPAGRHIDAGVDGLLDHRVRGLGHIRPLFVGDVVHRVGTERDQVLRHPMTPMSWRHLPAASRLIYERPLQFRQPARRNFSQDLRRSAPRASCDPCSRRSSALHRLRVDRPHSLAAERRSWFRAGF